MTYQGTLYTSHTADEAIKHCKKCNKCWELMEIEKSKLGKQTVNKYITFYEDFVTYGKEKITCPVCNGQTSDAQMLRGFLVYELIKS
jgi:hypothetical protein